MSSAAITAAARPYGKVISRTARESSDDLNGSFTSQGGAGPGRKFGGMFDTPVVGGLPSLLSSNIGAKSSLSNRSLRNTSDFEQHVEELSGPEPRAGWNCLPTFLDGGGLENLPQTSVRRRVHDFLDSIAVKAIMATVIVLNSIQVVYECDQSQKCSELTQWGMGETEARKSACDAIDGWLNTMNWTYLGIYSVELFLRIFMDRMRFFSDKWDNFDFVIVVVGFISQVLDGELPSPGILRLFRLARLAKAFRWVKLPPELHIMVHGLITAAKAIIMGTGLIAAMLVVWSVAAVEILNGKNKEPEILAYYESVDCERCPRAWDSVGDAFLSFLQTTLMGDSWGTLALPMIERHHYTIVVFVGASFSIVLGLTNLILAVIVDKALQQHDEDEHDYALERHKQMLIARRNFIEICEAMDSDGSGYLSLEEFLEGYANEQAFRDQLTMMGIQDHELEKLFHMIDKDRSGELSYQEFAQQLSTIKNQDLTAMASFMKHQIMEISLELADLKEALVPREDIVRMRVQREGTMENHNKRRLSQVQSLASGTPGGGGSGGNPSFEVPQPPSPKVTSSQQGSSQNCSQNCSAEEASKAPESSQRGASEYTASAGPQDHSNIVMEEFRRLLDDFKSNVDYQIQAARGQEAWVRQVYSTAESLARSVQTGEAPMIDQRSVGAGSSTAPASRQVSQGDRTPADLYISTGSAAIAAETSPNGKPTSPNPGLPLIGPTATNFTTGGNSAGGALPLRQKAGLRPREKPTIQKIQDEIRWNIRNLDAHFNVLLKQVNEIKASVQSRDVEVRTVVKQVERQVTTLIKQSGHGDGEGPSFEESDDIWGMGDRSPSSREPQGDSPLLDSSSAVSFQPLRNGVNGGSCQSLSKPAIGASPHVSGSSHKSNRINVRL